jgi:ATP-dependent DNA helicase RecQ
MRIERLSLSDAKENLKRIWGYPSFRTGQDKAIDSVLKGKETVVLFPTGGGKSLCYQVPATLFEGLTLVISPLVALMQDQVEQLQEKGVRATFINSTIPGFEVEQRLINARNGMYKLLYLAPERLSTPLWQNMVTELNLSLVAVDEAHCISQWGHDFRPSYRQIREHLSPVSENLRWMALTATATPEVRDDIISNLEFTNPVVVASGFKRPNLRWWVNHTEQKKQVLMKAVSRGVSKGSGIVYAGTRKECEKIAKNLSHRDIRAEAYHAGLSAERRSSVQKGWIRNDFPVVVATNAFGMGIDKPDCRFVIHYEIPYTLEAYYQEAGRAGRDGEEAYPVLIYKESDYHKAKARLLRTYPDLETLETLYDAICDQFNLAAGSEQEEAEPLSMEGVMKRSGLSIGEIQSGIKVLERLEILEVIRLSEPQLGIQFTVHLNILRQYINESKSEKAEFLDQLYRQYGPESFSTIYYLDLPYLLKKFDINRNSLLKAIRIFAEQDQLLNYQLLEEEPLIKLTEARRSRFPAGKAEVEGYRNILLKKLDRMKTYAETRSCREAFLRMYFGENDTEPCGQCDLCSENSTTIQVPDQKDMKRLREALNEPSSIGELLQKTGWKKEKLREVIQLLIVEDTIRKSENDPGKFIWKD